MNKRFLYPVEIYEWDFGPCDDIRRLIVKDESVSKKHHSGIATTWLKTHRNPEYARVTTFVQQCLDEIQQENNFDCDGFAITSMWGNYFPDGVGMTAHRHANSYWSGILYLSEGSPTVFYDPIPQRLAGEFELYRRPIIKDFHIDQNTRKIESVAAKEGKLIIFPSWFVHETPPSHGNRYSMSFNALPKGDINDGIATIDVL